MTITDRLNDLTQKMQQVVSQLQTLRRENIALQLANQELNARLEQTAAALEQARKMRADQVPSIPYQEVQGKVGADAPNPEPNHKLREEIEYYLAEIDKCIASLRQSETL